MAETQGYHPDIAYILRLYRNRQTGSLLEVT